MTGSLRIFRLMANPPGKDRNPAGFSPAAQLGSEWVDLKNTGTTPIDLSGTALKHKAYRLDGSFTWKTVHVLNGLLGGGQVIRVHSGRARDVSILSPECLIGAEVHIFSGRDLYVWNNLGGDTAALEYQGKRIDRATYLPGPPQGVILVRRGIWLVVPGTGNSGFGLGSDRFRPCIRRP